ncbi:MAG: hypothetical protein P8Y60_18685, partial [Calditrichota bacterium]
MKFKWNKIQHVLYPKIASFIPFLLVMLLVSAVHLQAQTHAFIKVGRFWVTVYDESLNPSADITSGWYPADFNVVSDPDEDIFNGGWASGGGGIELMMAGWDTIPKAIFSNISDYNPAGTVVEPLKSIVRYAYPENTVNFQDVRQAAIGEEDPGQLTGT